MKVHRAAHERQWDGLCLVNIEADLARVGRGFESYWMLRFVRFELSRDGNRFRALNQVCPTRVKSN
jgi:hypothetical protein